MILVFGASGKTGSAVVAELRRRRVPFRASYRNPDKLAEARGRGIDAVPAEYGDPASLDAALAGAERVFLVAPPTPALEAQERAAVEAAVRAGARHLVKVSVWGAFGGDTIIGRPHKAIEQLIAGAGLDWTFLRPNSFMQNLLASAPMIRHTGAYVFPLGGPVAEIDARDVGRVAAAALTEPRHEGRAYDLTGPKSLTADERMAILSEVLGRTIRSVAPPDAEWRAGAIAAGVSEWLADLLIDLQMVYREGGADRVTGEVERLTGTPPTSFRRFAEEHAAAFRA